jgi:hypothetical protein
LKEDTSFLDRGLAEVMLDASALQPGKQLSELQEARLSALLSMAETDAGIAA